MGESEVLFEITKENLETGLRGYPVGYCTTSTVDPVKGLAYVGKPVHTLIDWDPEQVIYLLYAGKEGSKEEVDTFKKDLASRAKLHPDVVKHILQLPRQGHPMSLFASALLITGMIEGKDDYKEDCLNLIAKVPQLAATVINFRAGWGDTPPPKPELGYMENFTEMLQVPNGDKKALLHVFRLFNILHYDHGGGNLSAFVGKAVASGLEDMYGSITGAMCALAGPLHGRANQECLEFIEKLIAEIGADATEEQLEKHLREMLSKNELVYGFGHAVLRVEDPRATVLYAEAERLYPYNPLVKMTKSLRTVGAKVLGENPKIADPYPNVDAVSGTLLSAAGFHYPDFFTVLFGLARIVGISIQIVYERLKARGGKGTPIVRPKYIYKNRND